MPVDNNGPEDFIRAAVERRISRREMLKQLGLLGLSSTAAGAFLSACGAAPAVTTQVATASAGAIQAAGTAAQAPTVATPQPAAAAGENVELLFTFWGSPTEKASVEAMVAAFNASHPKIQVRPQHIPTAANAYTQKMTTMLAAGTPPDVAYMDGALAFSFAADNKLLDLTSFFQNDPEAKDRLDSTYYRYEKKVIGASIGEIMLLYYNKDLFDAAKLPYPPAKAADAWSWDTFVDVAKKLTKDRNGHDATSANFDPANIDAYGLAFPQSLNGYLPLIISNGGKFANDDGTELWLNKPEAVEVLQKMQDLIYVHHVAPTPAQNDTFPATDIMMRTKKIAMDFNGHWAVLDYSKPGQTLNWSMGVLPRFKQPTTILQASARVIFAATKHPKEAFEFYKYHFSPTTTDLFKKGLWMPPQLAYYKDETKINEWLQGQKGVYPPEARDVLVDYTLNHTPVQPPVYWLKNLQQILTEAVNPAMQLLWTGKATAQQVADEAVTKAKPMMRGR
ncbi:MAG: hypothetical protein NVSMB42_08730 [Herpetosiphon sp.]